MKTKRRLLNLVLCGAMMLYVWPQTVEAEEVQDGATETAVCI